MDKSNKIIGDLMVQLGSAIGALKVLYWCENTTDEMECMIETIINNLEHNTSRIIKELDNEISS